MTDRGSVFKLSGGLSLSNTGSSRTPPIPPYPEQRRLTQHPPIRREIEQPALPPRVSRERLRLEQPSEQPPFFAPSRDKMPQERRMLSQQKVKAPSDFHSKPSVRQRAFMAEPPPDIPMARGGRQPEKVPAALAVLQKPIRQLKREAPGPEVFDVEQTKLYECKMGCGRSFNRQALAKHEKVCKKVFLTKRKEFNSEKQRIVAKEQVKLMKEGGKKQKVIIAKKQKEKKPIWKAQSQAFRGMLRKDRLQKDGKPVPKQLAQQLRQAQQQANNYVKCQYCGRSFNETAGPRHIAFCEKKAKQLKKGRR